MHTVYDVLIRPLATPKTVALEKVARSYTFKVALQASKPQIKSAIERFYSVKVARVNTMVMPGKPKRRTGGVMKTPSWKKAYVTLQSPHSLELFPHAGGTVT